MLPDLGPSHLPNLLKELKEARSRDLSLQRDVQKLMSSGGKGTSSVRVPPQTATRGLRGRAMAKREAEWTDELAAAVNGSAASIPGGGANNTNVSSAAAAIPTAGPGSQGGRTAGGQDRGGGEGGGRTGDGLTPRWSAATGNGADWPPFYTVFVDPPRSYAIACIVAAGCANISVLASAYQINRMRGCPATNRRALFMRIVGVIPVVGLTACLSTAFAAVSVCFELVRNCYVGLVVFWLLELGFEMLGGFEAACGSLAVSRPVSITIFEGQYEGEDRGSAGSPAAVFASRRLLMWVWWGATQFVYVNSTVSALLALLSLLSLVQHLPPFLGDVTILTMEVLQFASGLCAVLALTVFLTTTRKTLHQLKYTARGKLGLVSSVVLLNGIQQPLVRALDILGLIPDTAVFGGPAKVTLWANFLLALECVPLAAYAMVSFPQAELYDPEVRAPLRRDSEDEEERFALLTRIASDSGGSTQRSQ